MYVLCFDSVGFVIRVPFPDTLVLLECYTRNKFLANFKKKLISQTFAIECIHHGWEVWKKSITRDYYRHHSASLLLPNSDPPDIFFLHLYLHHIPMKDTYYYPMMSQLLSG